MTHICIPPPGLWIRITDGYAPSPGPVHRWNASVSTKLVSFMIHDATLAFVFAAVKLSENIPGPDR